MEDTDSLGSLKEMIALALDQCSDPDLLDLIYKLLTYDSIRRRSRRWLRHFFIPSTESDLLLRLYE